MTWGELKKEIDSELEDDAKIRKIEINENNFHEIEIKYHPVWKEYSITPKED